MSDTKQRILVSIADVESELNEWQKDQADLQSKVSVLNDAIAAVRQSRATEIAALEAKIGAHDATVRAWAGNPGNRKRFFKDANLIQFKAGTIAFRTNPPSVNLRAKMTMEKVVKAILGLKLKGLLKPPPAPTIDKEAIKRAVAEKKLDDAKLKKIGIEIWRAESLNITLNELEAQKA